jgi:hypothetical protein
MEWPDRRQQSISKIWGKAAELTRYARIASEADLDTIEKASRQWLGVVAKGTLALVSPRAWKG